MSTYVHVATVESVRRRAQGYLLLPPPPAHKVHRHTQTPSLLTPAPAHVTPLDGSQLAPALAPPLKRTC